MKEHVQNFRKAHSDPFGKKRLFPLREKSRSSEAKSDET